MSRQSRAARHFDDVSTDPEHRSVRVVLRGEPAWIRLRCPSATATLHLDVAAYTMSSLLQKIEEEAPAPDVEAAAAAAYESRRAAARAAAVENSEATIDRYLAESVCGVADPLDDGTSPDPNDATLWDPLEITERPARARPGRPLARTLSVPFRREVYLAVIAWVRSTGSEEVAASTATFRPAE
ncbi:MAG: hypothetical protein ACO3GM_00825 [Candidatus Limnocylindrus sp.]